MSCPLVLCIKEIHTPHDFLYDSCCHTKLFRLLPSFSYHIKLNSQGKFYYIKTCETAYMTLNEALVLSSSFSMSSLPYI